MIDSTDAGYLRRWAMQCLEQANNARVSGEERARLMMMRDALLTLADTQDWLCVRAKDSSQRTSVAVKSAAQATLIEV